MLKMCDLDAWKGAPSYSLNLTLFNPSAQLANFKIFSPQDIIEYKYGEYFHSKIFSVALDHIYFNLLQRAFNYFAHCAKVSFLGNSASLAII